MTRSTIDGGGVTFATGGGYRVGGTIGQPDTATLSGGVYSVTGGFWVVATCPSSSMPASDGIAKNRFVSIKTVDAGRDQAIRVRFVDLPSPFNVWNGMDFFAGAPREVCENSGEGLDVSPADCSVFAAPTRTFWAAPLVCDKGEAHYMDWHGWCNSSTCTGGLRPGASCSIDDDCLEYVHLYHEGLVPSKMETTIGPIESPAVFVIQIVDIICDSQNEASYSAPLTVIQSGWGDVCGRAGNEVCAGPPDDVIDVTNDVFGILDKFPNANNMQKARTDMAPGEPDFLVDVANDVLNCLAAFAGAPYPFVPGDPCNPG